VFIGIVMAITNRASASAPPYSPRKEMPKARAAVISMLKTATRMGLLGEVNTSTIVRSPPAMPAIIHRLSSISGSLNPDRSLWQVKHPLSAAAARLSFLRHHKLDRKSYYSSQVIIDD